MKCHYADLNDECEPGEICSGDCCPAHCAEGCAGRCTRAGDRIEDMADDLRTKAREEG